MPNLYNKFNVINFDILKPENVMKAFLLITLFSFLIGSTISGQDERREFRLSNSLPQEKVYLHLDRPNYMQGDTIWFKAYSWFGFEQLPDTVSKVLYVDFFNPKDSLEQYRKLLIQNGTSNGEFVLDKNITPGRYCYKSLYPLDAKR